MLLRRLFVTAIVAVAIATSVSASGWTGVGAKAYAGQAATKGTHVGNPD